MEMENSKYSPEEILQILNDFYHCQAAYDPEVYPGEDLTFETTIAEWRGICDLVEPKVLAKVYHATFKLSTPLREFEDILSTKTTTLLGFCRYVADHALKQQVSPILIMGQHCMTASIFKTLTTNLKGRGVDTQNIKPSSRIAPLFHKHGGILLDEVSKLSPGSLSKFEHQDNWVSKTGIAFNLLFFVSLIIVPIIWHFHWLIFFPLVIGVPLMYMGSKFNPAKEVIGGYDTIRELILGMEARMQNSK